MWRALATHETATGRGPGVVAIRICPTRFTLKIERISAAEVFPYIKTVKPPNNLGSDYPTISYLPTLTLQEFNFE